jgi:predicted ATPase
MHLLPLIILKHENPVDNNVKPALILTAGSWDDYGYKTSFSLKYRKENGDNISIGDVKIGSVDYKPNGDNYIDEIMDPFYPDGKLSAKFFSLGQDLVYYQQMKACFPECYLQILENLRDCVVLPTLVEKIEQEGVFKTSLLRSEYQKTNPQSAQEALDYGMDILNYGKKQLDQTFEYVFHPYEKVTPLRIHFDFNGSDLFPRRLYALIGDNGVGKTTLLNDIPVKLCEQKRSATKQFFEPYPLFKKIITISLNQYDGFDPPERSDSFNYVYCGLVDKKTRSYNRENIANRTIDSLFFIYRQGREYVFWNVLKELVNGDLIENLKSLLSDYKFKQEIDEDKTRNDIRSILKELSSGQNSMLSVFANVFAEIRFNSLLLMDEPETHLHPQAISKLMKMLLEILEYYKSFCILATHSPLIIRELTSDCVYVMDAIGTNRSVRFIGTESLGANLTTLTNEIFGINDENSYYVEKIKALKEDGKSEEDIISLITSKTGHSVSLNLRLFIASIFFESGAQK